MTIIAMQTPWPNPTARLEKPTPSTNALAPVATVPALPDRAAQSLLADHPSHRDRSRDTFTFHQSVARQSIDRQSEDQGEAPETGAPQPFPAMRFADPLPNLPELDLPAKATAYHTALTVLRGDEPV